MKGVMAMDANYAGFESKFGTVNIATDVIAAIAAIAALEIPGVAEMDGGLTGGFNDIIGRKNVSKGVRVSADKENIDIDLNIIVEYSSCIPDLAWKLQENVKRSVEDVTALTVNEVNIHVQGIKVKNEQEN